MKTKLILSIALTVVLLNSNLFAQYNGGDGTESNPYKINTMQHLFDLMQNTSDWDKHFIQTADLDAFSAGTLSPIGISNTYKFTGSYNGQGHTITNLSIAKINDSYPDNIGLFGYIYGATIKNLGLVSVTVVGGETVGGLVGFAVLNSVIDDCYTTGSVTGSKGFVGGLVGHLINSSSVKRSYSESTVVAGEQYVGGFVGKNDALIEECYAKGNVSNTLVGIYGKVGGFVGENTSSISNCFATGSVDGNELDYVGGFVGYNINGTIELSYATGNVTNSHLYVGGFAGANYKTLSATTEITRCYSNGDVSGVDYVGGFIGKIYNSDVKNCFSVGNITRITGASSFIIGGFCGEIEGTSTIQFSYSNGSVTNSSGSDGGFVSSENNFSGSYVSNYWDSDVSNQTSATGATSATTTNMQQQIRLYTDLSFTGTGLSSAWDFNGTQYNDAGTNDYWKMDAGGSYPILVSTFSTTTNTVSNITENSATSGGHAFNTGSETILERGVCWGTSSLPTIADSKQSGNSSWNYTANLSGLTSSTTYYVRAYITNNAGTSYGDEEIFTTLAATPVELTSFTAKLNAENVVLNWNTATEVNNYGFEIERKFVTQIASNLSNDEWENLGFVQGHGNSNSPKYYEFIDESPLSDSAEYRLKQIDTDGGFTYYDKTVQVAGYSTTDVNDANLPLEYKLEQNYPNPFNPSTTISFELPKQSKVRLSVYNALGEEVVELLNKNISAGKYQVNFDGSNLSSGLYFYKISTNNFVDVKKMILLK